MTYPNWFAQTAQHNFEEFLIPMEGELGLRFLQLGAFTGDASVWLCENVLTAPDCVLYDVDTWRGSDEPAHEEIDFKDVKAVYDSKTSRFNQIVPLHRDTISFFTSKDTGKLFDFIYVDADHTTAGVLIDAELSWRRLMPSGILAFDDYTWGHESGDPRLAPMVGIDLFLHRHQGDYELLAKNDQVWIKKK
jgi:predicted O-methyltransferase YrrM